MHGIMRLRIARTDGKTGSYTQRTERRAAMLINRLDPRTLFRSGPVVIGETNPFTVLNPDEICWVEVETGLETLRQPVPHIESLRRLKDRDEYKLLLSRQWPRWQTNPKGKAGDLLEALVEINFRGGAEVHLHVTGRVADVSLVDAIFGAPAITAGFEPDGTIYINPKAIARARVYHSVSEVTYPSGIWVASADEV